MNIWTVAIKNIRNMHAVSPNQIANILQGLLTASALDPNPNYPSVLF